MSEEMEEIIREFVIESSENLDILDQDLIALEKDPDSKNTVASIFRTLHTLKGGSGLLGFSNLERVAHAGENLLSRVRDGIVSVNSHIIDAMLATVDAVRAMLEQIDQSGSSGTEEFPDLVRLLTALSEDGTPPENNDAEPKSAEPVAQDQGMDEPAKQPESEERQETDTEEIGTAEDGSSDVDAEQNQSASVGSELHEAPLSSGSAVSQDARDESATQDNHENRPAGGSSASESTIRVDVGLLDKLMNLVGELVLARNQMLQFTHQYEDSSFVATSQRLNLITTELQENVMKTRMQPIGNIWGKLPRVVRDLASTCGKAVRLELDGKETELDKTIIEAIKDPLTHIVRNAVDHGIEAPGDRTRHGKPEEGTLKMRAYHEGGQVNIEIQDDGGGIHVDKVKARALSRGLITKEQAAQMADHEAQYLIFMPGFSTAEKITNVSGRGVGMDVVKTNIEKIGGTVDLQSIQGKGTTLKIKIPLTLAIIPALIVTCGGDRFAIPQVSLLELVRLDGDQPAEKIEMIHGHPVYRLRGQLLPIAYLGHELKLDDDLERVDETPKALNIVVLQAGGSSFGLVVDEINDTEEIVVKPLGKQLKSLSCFAGATIMGDGRVALILDVIGLAQKAGYITENPDSAIVDSGSRKRKDIESRETLLLFDAGRNNRMAIPLSMVDRLEEFNPSNVEFSGNREVIRYRDQIMPLIRVNDYIHSGGCQQQSAAESMQVVVYTENGRSIGIVVDRISDIVEENLSVKRYAHENGIFGSAVVAEKVTDLLDIRSIIQQADPFFFGSQNVTRN